jgi:ABC-type glycerol-3-phosphate transport system permease component
MMTFKKSLPLTAALMVPASFAVAHSGHDHGHWSSPGVHALLLVALASVLATGIWFYRRSSKNIQTEIKEK